MMRILFAILVGVCAAGGQTLPVPVPPGEVEIWEGEDPLLVLPAVMRPRVAERDAGEWFAFEMERVAALQGGSEMPAHGDLGYDTEVLYSADSPVVLPARYGLQGNREHLRFAQGFRPSLRWKAGEDPNFVVVVDFPKGRGPPANGNFGTNFVNVAISGADEKGHRVANGLAFGGANVSSIRNLYVEGFEGYGLVLRTGTSRCYLERVELLSREGPGREGTGTGILMYAPHGVSGRVFNVARCEVGIEVKGGHNVHLDTMTMEDTETVAVVHHARGVWLTGIDCNHTGTERGKPVFDLKNHAGDLRLSGTLRGMPGQVWYVGPKGKRQELGEVGTFAGSKGAGFVAEAWERRGDLRVEVVR